MPSVVEQAQDARETLLIDQAIADCAGRPGALLSILEAVQAADTRTNFCRNRRCAASPRGPDYRRRASIARPLFMRSSISNRRATT